MSNVIRVLNLPNQHNLFKFMLISQNSNANILAIAVLNFNMKTDSETLECLLFNQHKTKSLYNIATISNFFASANFVQMSEFRDILTKHTVKYIACSLGWYIIYACVLTGCDAMHFYDLKGPFAALRIILNINPWGNEFSRMCWFLFLTTLKTGVKNTFSMLTFTYIFIIFSEVCTLNFCKETFYCNFYRVDLKNS